MASISQVIVTLTLLLANAGPTTGILAYSCEDLRSPVIGYELTPQEGCWMKQPAYAMPVQRREDRVDARRGTVPCHSLQNDGNSDASGLRLRGQGRTWSKITMEKLVPVSPRGCMEISESRRTTLFDCEVALAENGTAT